MNSSRDYKKLVEPIICRIKQKTTIWIKTKHTQKKASMNVQQGFNIIINVATKSMHTLTIKSNGFTYMTLDVFTPGNI